MSRTEQLIPAVCLLPPSPAIILLSFVLAISFLLVILSCALWSNWLPLFTGTSAVSCTTAQMEYPTDAAAAAALSAQRCCSPSRLCPTSSAPAA